MIIVSPPRYPMVDKVSDRGKCYELFYGKIKETKKTVLQSQLPRPLPTAPTTQTQMGELDLGEVRGWVRSELCVREKWVVYVRETSFPFIKIAFGPRVILLVVAWYAWIWVWKRGPKQVSRHLSMRPEKLNCMRPEMSRGRDFFLKYNVMPHRQNKLWYEAEMRKK
jgi:hypothetical protein